MEIEYFAFGEILWDCLPTGRHAGGAPFNVAAHLAQLGGRAAIISAVGQDALGEEICAVARDKGVETKYAHRVPNGSPTGTVQVKVDANGNATYEIVKPVAWDSIFVSDELLAEVARARALVFGSLAARCLNNRHQLHRLLAIEGPLKFFDVNLRPPFDDHDRVFELGRWADVLKLNDHELGQLAGWRRAGGTVPRDLDEVREACAKLEDEAGFHRLCVTRGAEGAVFWENGILTSAAAPHVDVRDTVGAGDAFMAGLMRGLTLELEIQHVLESACRLGAFVASHHGATPLFPTELKAQFRIP